MAIDGVRLKGLEEVVKNLNKEIEKIDGRTKKGLIQACRKIRREGMLQTPRHYSNLVNSWYVSTVGGSVQAGGSPTFKGKDAGELSQRHQRILAESLSTSVPADQIILEIGLTANYAAYVHEMVGAQFRSPGKKAKFLEDPIKENTDTILALIRKEAKIK